MAPSSIDLQVEANLELVRRSIPGAMAYSVLLLVVGFFTPYTSDHPFVLQVTTAFLAAIGLARIILARTIQSRVSEVPLWARYAFRTGVFASAVGWSAFSALAVRQYNEQWTAMLLLLMTSGIAAGGMTSLAPDLSLARLYILIVLGPSIVSAATNGGQQGYAVAITVGTFTAFLLAESKHQNTSYWRAITDRAALKIKASELEEARKLADQATVYKSNFLANMSHEIRTPMNAILGMTELLLDSDLAPQHESRARTVKESAESLLTIIDDILDLSKIEAGKLELDKSNFHLRESIDDVLRTLSLRAHDKGLELSCRVMPDVPDALMGDTVRLKQVLTNLVGNAIKFTSQGGIAVEIMLEDKLNGAALLHLSVTDTGIGIPADKQKLIFEPFIQADSSTTRQYGGTGLGLSISKTFVEMMRGHIWFESEVGKGSIFHFTAQFDLQTDCPETETDFTPSEHTYQVGNRRFRILLAEDNPVNQSVAGQMLEKRGHDVVMVSNGREALERLSGSSGFDVVLMDIQMPEMDGFQATAAIRELEKAGRPYTPIIAMTAHAMKGDRERCLAAGMDSYVSKPVRSNELYVAIEKVARNKVDIRPEVSATETPALDGAAILERLGGDARLFQDVVDLFEDNYPKLISQMRSAIDANDGKALAMAAHTLKGSLLILSAEQALTATQKIEKAGRNGDLSSAPALVVALDAALSQLSDQLELMAEAHARP